METSPLNEGFIKGVQLAVSKNQGGLGALFGGLSKRDAEANEAAIASLGIPYTIVRAGSLKDEEGGKLGFRYGQVKRLHSFLFFVLFLVHLKGIHLLTCNTSVEQGGNVQGSISREDAAYVCVEALDSPPQSARVFEVLYSFSPFVSWCHPLNL